MAVGMFGGSAKKLDPTTLWQNGFPTQSAPLAMGNSLAATSQLSPAPSGFNAPGGWAEKLGAIGSILRQAGGQQDDGFDQFQAIKQARIQQALQQQQYQQRRADENGDWLARQQWELAHPKPVSNDTANDVALYDSLLGPGKGKQFLENQLDPIVNIPLPGGRVYVGPRSGIGAMTGGAASSPAAQPQGPAPGAVEGGYRFKGGNPADPTAWEQVGGAGSQAPRTFR